VGTCDQLGVYTPLQTARVSAERVLRLLESWTDAQVPQRGALIATMQAYAGYSTLLLGEGFCTMAISSVSASGEPIYGGEIQPDSVLKLAEARFTRAIDAATAAGVDSLKNLALVGRARARLDLGRYAAQYAAKFGEARTDAGAVPVGFRYDVTASDISARRQNRVYAQNSSVSTATSVGERFRPAKDTIAGAPRHIVGDPRVLVDSVKTSSGALQKSTTGVPLFRQKKYTSFSSPIRLASYVEARFIAAEADLQTNTNLTEAIGVIDSSRARGNETPTTSTTATQLLADLLEERRRELWLESQHLADVIYLYPKLNQPLYPAAGAPYPGGGTYGDNRCLQLPLVERQNNPAVPG
jgi:hypothetical protein